MNERGRKIRELEGKLADRMERSSESLEQKKRQKRQVLEDKEEEFVDA